MIHKEKCYCVTCDNCGKTYECVNTGFSLWVDVCSANEGIQEADWYTDGDKHYCPDCYTVDDNDNLIIKD